MVEGIYRLFDSIWRLSLVGSYCILLVILARFLLKKAPKWCSYLLWGIVFVRLCCPVLPDQSDPGASVDRRDGDNLCTVGCREQCRIS